MNAENQQTPSQSLKLRLVEVATELLSKPRDVKLPTMREIASAADVAPGAAYRHFESQDALFLEVVTNLFDQLERSIVQAVAKATSSEDAVFKTCEAFALWGLGNPGGYQLLFETTDDLNMKATELRPGLHLIGKLAELLAAPQQPNEQTFELATRLWTSVHGLVSLRLHKLGMTWSTSLEHEIKALVKAIGAN